MNGDDTKCTQCGGTGFVLFKKEVPELYADGVAVEFARRCPACNGGEAIVRHVKRVARIPESFYNVEFADFDWTIYQDDNGKQIDLTKQQKYVTSFVKDFKAWSDKGIGLYIWSKTRGTGKTFLASAICNTLIKERHLTTKFVSVSNLIDLVQESKGTKTNPIMELCECDILVLDDLGQQNAGNGWLMDILFRICDTRMQTKRITIVTSNKRLRELNFDDRILDRLNKMLQQIPLPDCCVRDKESSKDKMDLFTSLGLMRKKDEPTYQQQVLNV